MRRPRLVIAGAILTLLFLGALGAGVNGKLRATSLAVPGTESNRGDEMLRDHFGESAPFAILLQGPASALDRQGPRLVSALLSTDPQVTTVSPWDRGAGLQSLRPNPRTALIMTDFHVSIDTAMSTTVPQLERIVRENIALPVRAHTAGSATVARAILEESVESTRRGEMIVAPILLLILLLVFRSPVAAAIPLAFGATTVIAARGVIAVIAGFVGISGFALSIGTMIGLALGVDYALLIVSRFREELARGADPAEAATVMRLTAGRTTVFAGGTLLMAVLIAALIVPGALLFSLCATVATVIVLAVVGPWVVGPAILVLLGHNIDRWRIGTRAPTRTRWLIISRAALRRPYVAVVAIAALLVLVAFPAASLATGPVTIEQLPRSNKARLDVEAIEAAVGGGWVSPAVVVAVDEHGPITQPKELRLLEHWQRSVADQPGIDAVIGPGPLVKKVAPLQRASQSFIDGDRSRAGRISVSVDRARSGLERLRRGLGLASEGARLLAVGSGRAQAGAGLLAKGFSLGSSGGATARSALQRFRHGAHLLAAGERNLALGMSLLEFSVGELASEITVQAGPQAKQLTRQLQGAAGDTRLPLQAATVTVEKLEAAWRELQGMSIGTGDPRYAGLSMALREALTAARGRDPVNATSFAPGYDGLPSALRGLAGVLGETSSTAAQLNSELSGAHDSLTFIAKLTRRLRHAVARLAGGSHRLAGGSDRIVSGAARLSAGLGRLEHGAQRLSAGLGRLSGGNAQLECGLSSAFRRMAPLVAGAREAEVRITTARRDLRRSSPGFFNSGYFVLSALDGAPPRSRRLAGQAIDLRGGGQATKILVIDSEREVHSPGLDAQSDRLRLSADRLAASSGMQVAVTGGVAQSIDYERATSARILPLVIAITAVTFIAMLMILRALPLAGIAIALNLLTVAAAFGVLKLLTFLPESWPFGGTHHIDPVAAAGIFGVVFGLSIDYAVFLLTRMRESWERKRDNEAAISYGLTHTASVITGAATIMAVVFIVFATAPIQSVSQFGISLTVAVMLDATLVRLMLVPALMKSIGPRVWWLPAWLDRFLPRLDVEGEKVAR